MKNNLFLFILLFFSLTACGPSYNTDFQPPKSGTNPADVFPEKIAGLDRMISMMTIEDQSFIGVKSVYGSNDILIEVVKASNTQEGNRYVDEFTVPRIDSYSSHGRARVNGVWTGRGSNSAGEKIYAWQNQNWVYLITAKSNELFEQAIKEFKYIDFQ
jgi:hypothetical protein